MDFDEGDQVSVERNRRSPAEIRDVFAANLKTLAQQAESVSKLCLDLGINRTQFNRYLSGEAYPRPDVLDRICRHFRCDARILLEPLADMAAAKALQLPAGLDVSAFASRMRDFDHRRMPDGFYRMVRPAPVAQRIALLSMLVLKTLPDGATVARAAVPAFYMNAVGSKRPAHLRRLQSMVFQAGDGVAMLFTAPAGTLLQFCFIGRASLVAGDQFAGFSAFSLPPNPYQSQIIPIVLEWVGTTLAQGIEARRNGTTIPMDQLRPLVRDYFDSWNPLGPLAQVAHKGHGAG